MSCVITTRGKSEKCSGVKEIVLFNQTLRKNMIKTLYYCSCCKVPYHNYVDILFMYQKTYLTVFHIQNSLVKYVVI